jgi:predicted nucleic acid-binding protein
VAPTLIYLDSSVALRTILDVPERERLQAWMQARDTTFVSSRLLRTEMIRVLRREGRSPSEGGPLFDRVGMLEITRETHTVAESIERHVKTLDALHVATALLIGESITVATHDTAMKDVATHLGLPVIDPVAHPSAT